MKSIRSFFPALCRSFGYASHGILIALTRERNLRIHLVAGAFVLYLCRFYALSRAELGLLVLCVGGVTACEMVNTAIERAVDLQTPDRHPLAGAAKDAAAGAVLISAITSVVVGVLLFGDLATLRRVAQHMLQRPLLWLGLGILAAFWIALPIRRKEEAHQQHESTKE